MKLVRGGDIRLRLGLPDVDTIVAAADNAAEEASLQLENDLRTPLLQATYSDLYLIREVDWRRPVLRLKLTAGFVADGWQVGTGTEVADAQADTSFTDQVIFDKELGSVLLRDLCLNQYLSVRYTAGFPAAASPNTENLFDMTTVPDWLAKAAEVKSIALMAQSPEFANKDGTVINGAPYDKQYNLMIQRHIRFMPDSRLPLS